MRLNFNSGMSSTAQKLVRLIGFGGGVIVGVIFTTIFFNSSCNRPPVNVVGTYSYQGRLGNLMFQYAAAYAVASRTNRVPVIPHSDLADREKDLTQIFKGLSAIRYNSKNILSRDTIVYTNTINCGFDPIAFTKANESAESHIFLSGYFQSFKYLDGFEEQIRQEFRFHNQVVNEVNKFLSTIKKGHKVTIGMHIRMGDFTSKFFSSIGYQIAPVTYLKKAMEYFRKKYDNCVFVVCTDDVKWSKEALKDEKDVMYSIFKKASYDMALLVHCDHTLLTVGSFGWWSGFLNRGETVYYPHPVRPGSGIAKDYVLSEYYPPDWTALDPENSSTHS